MQIKAAVVSTHQRDFCFCGNEPVKGLPYCLGHARIAYRPAGIAAARLRER